MTKSSKKQKSKEFVSVRKKLTLRDIVRNIKFLIPLKVQDAPSFARTILMNKKNS